MNTEQAISLLDKIAVEQQTLMQLMPQFTVAMQELKHVAEAFRSYSKDLPELTRQHASLSVEISTMVNKIEADKKRAAQEVGEYRATLEAELGSIEVAIREARKKLTNVQADLTRAEAAFKNRIDELDKTVKQREARLADVNTLIKDIKEKL